MSESARTPGLFLPAPEWKGRCFAFLRFLGFVTLAAVVMPLVGSFADFEAAGYEGAFAIQEVALGLGVLAATVIMARIGRRRLRDFGLGGANRSRNFMVGLASGAAFMLLLLLVMRAASVFSFGWQSPLDGTTLSFAVLYALLMLAVGFSEEMLFRGYALVALSESLSFWPATALSCGAFALIHSGNGGETAWGLLSAAAFGGVAAYSFRATRSLWFAIGFHASWDYAESFIFGVPDSGTVASGRLFHPQFDGPSWITGGSAGPEASILIVIVFALMLLVIRRLRHPGNVDAPSALMAASELR